MPQTIQTNGADELVVITKAEYDDLSARPAASAESATAQQQDGAVPAQDSMAGTADLTPAEAVEIAELCMQHGRPDMMVSFLQLATPDQARAALERGQPVDQPTRRN